MTRPTPVPPSGRARLEPLFAGWDETPIWSCLQGCMGEAWADRIDRPQSARLLVGDFCFLAGRPDEALAVDRSGIEKTGFVILMPQEEGWSRLLERLYGSRAKRVQRYATRKEPDVFDRRRLCAIAESIPGGYEIRPIDERLYRLTGTAAWSRDLCGNFSDYERYRKFGGGYAALWDGVPVSGASSYSYYRGGIEIEVDTREDHRRRGLAAACSARLILECIDQNRYPSWDAHNPGSLALAERLGYRFDRAYPAYETEWE